MPASLVQFLSTQSGPTGFRRSNCILALYLICFAPVSGNGQVVITKDGFVIHGAIKRETGMITDPGGAAIPAAKLNGFFWIDDGPRRIALSHRQIQDVSSTDKSREKTDRFEKRFLRLDRFRLPAGYITDVGTWNPKWDRTIKLNGRTQIDQHLAVLTSHFARVDAKRYNWSPHYLISEMDPGEVRTLLQPSRSQTNRGQG